MNTYKTKYLWDVNIQMFTSTGEQINITITESNFVLTNGKPTEAKLTITINKKTYQIIDSLEDFNLKQEARNESSVEKFSEKKPIEIELILNNKYIEILEPAVDNAENLIKHLIKVNKNKINSPLLQTQNWFALYIKQEIDIPNNMEGNLKMGYSTKWIEKFEEKIIPTLLFKTYLIILTKMQLTAT